MDTNEIFSEPIVQSLEADWIADAGVTLSVLRLDTIHPVISGNKWFKLKENIQFALDRELKTLLTYGGAWSNHLVATAAAAREFGFHSVGVVGSYQHDDATRTETLKRCEALGMELVGVSRVMYRQRYTAGFSTYFQNKYPDCLIIPEGGNNAAGIEGAGEIAEWLPDRSSHVVLSVGTGTTFSGIRNATSTKVKMLGFGPFKQLKEQQQNILTNCPDYAKNSWMLFPDRLWKGFGKFDAALLQFMNDFYQLFRIPLDVVYTAKMMYYLKEQIQAKAFRPGSAIVAIHTGGLQGNFSVKDQLCFPL